VIYDLMIHDLDILLALVKEPVTEVKAGGHSGADGQGGHRPRARRICWRRGGQCHRQPRFHRTRAQNEIFSAPRIYLTRLRAARCAACRREKPGPQPEFGFEKLAAPGVEPLRAELEAFAAAVRTRVAPKTDGVAGRAALELASRVMQSIREHDERVQPVAKRPDAKGPAAKSYPDKASQ